jgi:hypothetical protein
MITKRSSMTQQPVREGRSEAGTLPDPKAGGHSATRSGDRGKPISGRGTGLDALRNALAIAFLAAVYALMIGGLFHLVRPAPASALLRAFVAGYAWAVLLFAGAHAVAWVGLRPVTPARRAALLPLAGPFASLVASAAALPGLFHAPDLAALVRTATFLSAGVALSATHDFYAGLRRRFVPARRVRDVLARRPATSRWLLRWLHLLIPLGGLWPWLAGGVALLLCPPLLRERISAYLILVTYLAHHLNQKLLEELTVWAFLHALRAGDFASAARLRIRASRLAAEIEAAPADLEAPFASFLACGLQGLEGLALAPDALGRLMRVYLSAYGLTVREAIRQGTEATVPASSPRLPVSPSPRHSDSLIRRLLDCGVRFRGEWEPAIALEPIPLPRWAELRRAEARARLAALYPDEPLWRVIARLYEAPLRTALLPVALLWLPLLGAALFLAGSGRDAPVGGYALLLAGAALSFALLLWLTLLYGNWVCDESLRRRDFAFLARQLANGAKRGELEDAMGAQDPRVRDRAVELLLFDDDVARLGLTVPPAGLRKFLKRAQ